MISPREFVEGWAQSHLREQQAAQSHFNELCQLVGHKTPTQLDPDGTFFTFEENVGKATGGKGRADVWYKGRFAWEYKGKHKDLDAAYSQLLAYKGGLENPPLLVVCDFLEYRIYPQWPNTSGLPFVFKNEDLLRPEYQRFILWLLEAPEKFLELRQSELERREKITYALAEKFAHLTDLMRQHSGTDSQPLWEPIRIARFLTKLVFAMFAEDVGLLPRFKSDSSIGSGLSALGFVLAHAGNAPEAFAPAVQDLFRAMDGQTPYFFMQSVPYFNGNLFADSRPGANDGLEVLDLAHIPGAFDLLREVAQADWSSVNPTIFGTLFEGALDISKRAQLGAHYTGEADIRLVVEPVLMQPLYREWESVQAEAGPLLQTYLTSDAPKSKQTAHEQLIALFDRMMTRLESTRVLDPACGSGNFLYMSLRALKDLEGRVRRFFEPLNLPFRDVVTPRQLYGIEKDEFAANLAKVVVWIGYLQWRYEDEGGILHVHNPRKYDHPRALPHPILRDKNNPDEPDRIICDDAIMRYRKTSPPDPLSVRREGESDDRQFPSPRSGEGPGEGLEVLEPYEPDWPEVDVIMGNPPFLGDKRMRAELGDHYVDDLRVLYEGRVAGGADLVTYWYEKARTNIEKGKAANLHVRTGLLATQSIRMGANREVLERIKATGNIFMAWSDRPWVLKGAAVRISIVGFDDGTEKDYRLDDVPVTHLNSDLQNTIDATKARTLSENAGLAFQGPVKVGDFDIPSVLAQKMLKAKNKSKRSNSDVIKPYVNGNDIVQRSRNHWIIDFGLLSEDEAARYEMPFKFVEENVKPSRLQNRDRQRRTNWWRLGRSGEDYKQAVTKLNRQIFTPRVARHRIFTIVEQNVFPDSRVFAICRNDDYFFGVLHSYIHEVWSLRLASRHGVGNDPTYNAQSCFETFPFPWPPGKEDTASPHYAAISAAARQLHEERETWLNPPELLSLGAEADSPALRERTLTNLYNALVAYRTSPLNPLSVHGEGTSNRDSLPVYGEGRGGVKTNGGEVKNSRIPRVARDFAPHLAELHDALDRAVLSAYGWEDFAPPLHEVGRGSGGGVRLLRTPDGDEELLRRLLALNLQRAAGQE